MTDNVKIAGIIMSAVATTALAIVGVVGGYPELNTYAKAFGSVFGLLTIGIPILNATLTAVKKLVR